MPPRFAGISRHRCLFHNVVAVARLAYAGYIGFRLYVVRVLWLGFGLHAVMAVWCAACPGCSPRNVATFCPRDEVLTDQKCSGSCRTTEIPPMHPDSLMHLRMHGARRVGCCLREKLAEDGHGLISRSENDYINGQFGNLAACRHGWGNFGPVAQNSGKNSCANAHNEVSRLSPCS